MLVDIESLSDANILLPIPERSSTIPVSYYTLEMKLGIDMWLKLPLLYFNAEIFFPAFLVESGFHDQCIFGRFIKIDILSKANVKE